MVEKSIVVWKSKGRERGLFLIQVSRLVKEQNDMTRGNYARSTKTKWGKGESVGQQQMDVQGDPKKTGPTKF